MQFPEYASVLFRSSDMHMRFCYSYRHFRGCVLGGAPRLTMARNVEKMNVQILPFYSGKYYVAPVPIQSRDFFRIYRSARRALDTELPAGRLHFAQ